MKRFKKTATSPKFMMWTNGLLAAFFALLIVPALMFKWVESTTFVSVLSIWALTASHWAAWQGGHAEKKEDERAAED